MIINRWSVSAGAYSTALLTRDGAVVLAGRSAQGERRNAPSKMAYRQVAAYTTGFYCLDADGWVSAHGDPYNGSQLGLPTVPLARIAAGNWSGFGLTWHGRLVAWGQRRDTAMPQGVFCAVVGGGDGGYALTFPDRRIVPFGSTINNRTANLPTGPVLDLAATTDGAYVLHTDGSVTFFGNDDNNESDALPGSGDQFVAVFGGRHSGAALRADGTAHLMGRSSSAADPTQNVAFPSSVSWASMAFGGEHGVGISRDGRAYWWGLREGGNDLDWPADATTAGRWGGHSITELDGEWTEAHAGAVSASEVWLGGSRLWVRP